MIAYMTRPSGIYLRLFTYRIVPANVGLRRFVSDLEETLSQGVLAQRDENRDAFYEVTVAGRCLYIHVYHEGKTVYLLASFSSEPLANHGAAPNAQMSESVAVPA